MTSSSDSAFALLAPGVQRQLYAMKWPALRPIQVDAIRAWFRTNRHLLLMAETAGGKTEAAFLPVLSAIGQEPAGSVRAVYVGPLKALINDQFARLEELCTHLDVPVHRWHGDVGQAKKDALVREPGGVLLITPESLESLLVNRTAHLPALFGGLRAVVIDELHAFLDGERGTHLSSLLARLRRYRHEGEAPWRMLGLSATIGDPDIARRYLAPDDPASVETIADAPGQTELRMRVHGYDGHELMRAATHANTVSDQDAEGDNIDSSELLVLRAIAEDLVEHCHGSASLVFANAKGDIELLADMANQACRDAGLPEQFLVHHGSLSREVREDTEARMKTGGARTTICSSTLEMGIDIGSVRTVGQKGAPWSVASFKQRLGRSGRRGDEPRRVRCYVDCTVDPDSENPIDELPLELLQGLAVCSLLLEHWVEPPDPAHLDLSTLTHQVISSIAEAGALRADTLHERLCIDGPFRACDAALFGRVLRALGAKDVIEQGPDGALILGLLGEKLRARQDFYAAFATPVEYTLIAGSRTLGTWPTDRLPKVGKHVVFAAQRWLITDIDDERRKIHVVPARRGERPTFGGGASRVHHRIIDCMLRLLSTDEPVPYADATTRDALEAARRLAAERDLARRRIVPQGGKSCLWLTWSGGAETRTYQAFLASAGVSAEDKTIALACACSAEQLRNIVFGAEGSSPDLRRLATHVQPKARRKYDDLLPEELLDEGISRELVWLPFDASLPSS